MIWGTARIGTLYTYACLRVFLYELTPICKIFLISRHKDFLYLELCFGTCSFWYVILIYLNFVSSSLRLILANLILISSGLQIFPNQRIWDQVKLIVKFTNLYLNQYIYKHNNINNKILINDLESITSNIYLNYSNFVCL